MIDFNLLVGLAKEEKMVPKNTLLFGAGMHADALYYVEEGCLKLTVIQEDQEQIIRLGYRGNFIAALDCWLAGTPTVYALESIKQSRLKIIPKKLWKEFIGQSSDHLLIWNQLLEQLVLQQLNRELDLLCTSPQERYHRVLARSPQLFQEVPGRYIANYLRMSPETLSRLKKS